MAWKFDRSLDYSSINFDVRHSCCDGTIPEASGNPRLVLPTYTPPDEVDVSLVLVLRSKSAKKKRPTIYICFIIIFFFFFFFFFIYITGQLLPLPPPPPLADEPGLCSHSKCSCRAFKSSKPNSTASVPFTPLP